MNAPQVAAALTEIGTLLELQGGNPYRAQAYHTGARLRIDQASDLADTLLAAVRAVPGVVRAEACGSLRRRKETIGDLDILCSATDPAAVMQTFVTLPPVVQVLNHGETLSSVML